MHLDVAILVCLLCIKISAVHPVNGVLFGGRFTVVVGIPCAGGGMVVVGAARNFCAVAASGGAFGCAGAPGRIVSCAGDANVGNFS